MKLKAIPLEFIQQDGIVKPVNDVLFDKVVKFMERHMGCRLPLAQMARVWVTVEVEDDGTIRHVTGLFPLHFVPDSPAMRFLNRESANLLIDRARGYLEDNGWSGKHVFIYIKDGDDPHRCPGYMEVLEGQKAEAGERWVVKV